MSKIRHLSHRLCILCAVLCAFLVGLRAAAQVTSTIIATPGGGSITGTTPVAAYADVYGNLFVITGATTSSVVEIPANGGPLVTIATGLNTARGVAADPLGNVYVSQVGATSILKYAPGDGSPTNIGTIEGRAFLMTLDNASPANLYVTDQDGERIEKINTSTGVQVIPTITGLNGPKGVALDAAGDLYVSNFNGNSLTELTAGGVVNQLALSGLNGPYGLAFDAAGDLFVMNAGNGELLEYPAGFTTSTSPTVVVSGITTSGESVVVNARGDLIYTNSSHVYALQAAAGNFYGTAVGGTSAATATAITYTFSTATTLGTSPAAYLSNNAATPQFATSTSTGDTTTCTANKAIAANGSCVLYAAAVPTLAGPVTGGVNLLNNAGGVVATTLLTGVGIAPAAAFGPGTQTVFASSGLSQPTGVAVDAGGNVYLTDVGNTTVKKVSGGTTTTLGFTGLSRPYGVAVDGLGSVYVADNYTYAVYKLTSAGVQSTVPTSGLHSPKGIAVDGLGDLYIADSVNARVVKVSAAGRQTVLGFAGLTSPAWVAVDFAGDVFVTDSGKVYELSAAGVQSTVTMAGLGTPAGISAGADGTLYVVDSGNGDIDVLTPGGTSFTLALGLTSAAGLAMAANGNLFVGNAGASQVTELSRTAETLTFPTTPVNTTSAALTATVQNIGNATLAYSNFAVANVSGAGFAQKAPVNDTTDCYPAATLTAGALCQVNILFTPTATGTITGTATSTDDALNVAGSQQVVSLTGTGGTTKTSTTTTVVQTVPAAGNPVYGQTFTVQATVAPSSGGGTPTGTVTFYLGGTQLGGPVTLSSGVASYSPTGINAGVGQTITADYSGDSNYSASSGNIVFTMSQATPVVTWSPSSTQLAVDAALGSGVLDATVGGGLTGTFVYSAVPASSGTPVTVGPTTVLTANTYNLSVTFTPGSQYSQNYGVGSGSVNSFLVGCYSGTQVSGVNQIVACNSTFADNFSQGYLDPKVWTNSYTDNSTWKGDRPVWMPDTFDFLTGGGLAIRADARNTYFADGLVNPVEADCQSSSPYYKCFSSGAITTDHSFSQAFGYFEIKAKLYPGPGAFPAFWMLPVNGPGTLQSAPTTKTNGISEIDVFEFNTTNLDNAWYGTTGSGGSQNGHVELGSLIYNYETGGTWQDFDPTSDYHTYSLAWAPANAQGTASILTFYTDGVQRATYNTSSQTDPQYAFPMYLLVDADLGPSSGGPTQSSLPQYMDVAYVHAYQYNSNPTTPALEPVLWGKPLINNVTANPGAPTVYSYTVNPGDSITVTSSLTNNTTTETFSNTSGTTGPILSTTVKDYMDVDAPANPSTVTPPNPIGPGGSYNFTTTSWQVPTNYIPGIYSIEIGTSITSKPDALSWVDGNGTGAAATRLTVVTEPRQTLASGTGGYNFVAGEPQSGTFTASGNTITMSGNMWVAGPLNGSQTYTTTPYTMLEFDFSGSDGASEYAIGLFSSTSYSQTNLFQLGGTSAVAGFQQYNHYLNSDGTVHYMIPVGQHLTVGTAVQNILFVNTIATGNANGTFSNIRLYDLPLTTNNPNAIPALTMPCFTTGGSCQP